MGKNNYENLIGRRFNRLTVVNLKINEKAEKRYKREWICLCDCGNYKTVRRPDALKCGYTKSCGCLSKETILKAVKKITLPEGLAAFNALYSEYKKTAKNKKFEFDITKKQFKILTKASCFYCGIRPDNIFKPAEVNGGYNYNGIDRVDNNIGYVSSNCVPCCKECNYMKWSLSIEDFLNHTKMIHIFQKDKIPRQSEVENFNDSVAMNVVMWEYKKNAYNKKLTFKIKTKNFYRITKGNCTYCGVSPNNIRYTPNRKRKYTFNGIDRIENSIGYENKNCTTCCKKCNYMKRNYSKDLFLSHIEKVYTKHRNL